MGLLSLSPPLHHRVSSAIMSVTFHPARHHWNLRPQVVYLNHGSFGPAPGPVLAARNDWFQQLESEPMDFFVRQLEGRIEESRDRLGKFVGTAGRNLIFVDNATYGMNLIANSFPLDSGDEVLATDHEYGAVLRIWRKRCRERDARLVVQRLPQPLSNPEEVVEALLAGATPKTRLLVVSHVTVCVDGPHAPAAVDIQIDRLPCDYYTASCHKWLSAPFGSGFLYAHPSRQGPLSPVVVSWGDSLSGRPSFWQDEFTWAGTRDPSAYLSVPAAIDFLESLPAAPGSDQTGVGSFRRWSHGLARHARERITRLTGLEPMIPDAQEWYGPMISLPLPETIGPSPSGHGHPLQATLWERYQIEAPIMHFGARYYIRVSCHLYNDQTDVDRLVEALGELLREA
jgi:isopenicillin-N epimerase